MDSLVVLTTTKQRTMYTTYKWLRVSTGSSSARDHRHPLS